MLQQDAGEGAKSMAAFVSVFITKYLSGKNTSGDAVPKAHAVLKPEARVRAYPKPSGYNKYTYAEVAKHTSPTDAWLVVEDKVYDVSCMQHPGGDVIFSYAGRDATELFTVMHKNQPVARAYLKPHLIGEVAKPEQTELLRDWHAMREKFTKAGLMDASPTYYARKMLELFALAGGATYLNFAFPTSLVATLIATLLMATFFYQNGWTQHDFQHNQVFRSHKLNALVGGWIISLGMGGSSHWWKTKHNQHHATPNKMDHDNKHAMDPDIDTVPLIAWSEALLKQVNIPDRGIIVLQHILIWPMLFIALVNWQMQSILHVLSHPDISAKQQRYEMAMMIIHHVWVAAISFIPLGLWRGLLFWGLSHALGGFVTAFVFVQSHNAMEIYTDDKDFVTSQMVSTRNINPGVVADWIMGGLNYQIEHHLFPTMPRHSFSTVRKDIMEFCARHGLPYESCSIWESTGKIYHQLASVAKVA